MWSSTVLVMAENIPITEKFSPEQLDLEEDIEGGLEKITLDLNELSDEEKYSQTMPEKHKCDGCMAIAYTLHTALRIKHLKNQHIKQYRIAPGSKDYSLSLRSANLKNILFPTIFQVKKLVL